MDMENLRQVPIGIQSFNAIREKEYSYIYSIAEQSSTKEPS